MTNFYLFFSPELFQKKENSIYLKCILFLLLLLLLFFFRFYFLNIEIIENI